MKVYNYEERLYSTGSDELDELLERAFCEGYEYAQYEFSDEEGYENDDNGLTDEEREELEALREKDKKYKKRRKARFAAAGTVATGGGLYLGAKNAEKLGEKLADKIDSLKKAKDVGVNGLIGNEKTKKLRDVTKKITEKTNLAEAKAGKLVENLIKKLNRR